MDASGIPMPSASSIPRALCQFQAVRQRGALNENIDRMGLPGFRAGQCQPLWEQCRVTRLPTPIHVPGRGPDGARDGVPPVADHYIA